MSTLTIPFTYILKFKPTNQWYYGVRWAKGCSPNDLWNTYFSSSTHVKNLIKQYGKDSFEVRVSKIFSSKEQAIHHEKRFLYKVKASTNGCFINKRNNMPDFSAEGLILICHPECNLQTWHDPLLPIPSGWEQGRLNEVWNKGKKNTQIPWNKGKSTGSTGPCSQTRKSNISKGRLKTKKVICEHCSKEVDPANYKRFHGENCKKNPNVNLDYWKQVSNSCKEGMKKQIDSGKFNQFGRKIA